MIDTHEMGSTSFDVAAAAPTILCVDDEPNILSALRRLFRANGFQVRLAESGKAGLLLLEEESVDLVISDMRMPEMNGTQFLAQVRVRWPDTVRLLLTGYSDVNSIIDAINRGEIFRYIAKPWDDNDIILIVRQAFERKILVQEKQRLESLTFQQNEDLKTLNASLEARVQARTLELSIANESLQEANDKLKSNFVTTLKVFSTLIEMRGGGLAGHSRRVADMARRIAKKLELDAKKTQEIFVAGLLHEIGKVGFSDELLATPVGTMKPAQLEAYRNHPLLAEQLLLPLQDLKEVSDIISSQFERFDGEGYPDHLAADAIPLASRILSLASDYDNMQTGTLTQSRLTPDEARIIVLHGSGKRYDPKVVEAFMELFRQPASAETDLKNVREIQVACEDLRAGMVLSRDLITPMGLLMLSSQHVLDERLIRKIKNFEKSTGKKLVVHIHVN